LTKGYVLLDAVSEMTFIWSTDGCETVVWCTCEGDQVDLWGGFGHGDFAGVADRDVEESVCHDRVLVLIFQ
jgi:hypothetical protein